MRRRLQSLSKITDKVCTEEQVINRNHKLYQAPKPVEKKKQNITIREPRKLTKEEKKILKKKILSLGLEYKPSESDSESDSEIDTEEKQEEIKETIPIQQVQSKHTSRVNLKQQMIIDSRRANMVKTAKHRPNRTKIVDKIICTNTETKEDLNNNTETDTYYKLKLRTNSDEDNVYSDDEELEDNNTRESKKENKINLKLDLSKAYTEQTIIDDGEENINLIENKQKQKYNNIDFFMANILEQKNYRQDILIKQIKLELTNDGIRFHFDINKQFLTKSKGFTINYEISREKLFATLHSEIPVSSISRLLSRSDLQEFNKIENDNGRIIFITVNDLYESDNENKIVQEFVINLEGLI